MSEKIQLFISRILQLIMAVAILLSFFQAKWIIVFASALALISTFLPSIISKNYKIYLPIEFHLITTVFIYATIFLGEIQGFYTKFWWWDIVLHGGSAVIFGIIGFLILFTLYAQEKVFANPLILSIFSFAFAVAIGASWEIFEFAADSLFGFNLQGSGLLDTMGDLIVNGIGALLASISGYFYIKKQGKGVGILGNLINKFLEKNPRLMKF